MTIPTKPHLSLQGHWAAPAFQGCLEALTAHPVALQLRHCRRRGVLGSHRMAAQEGRKPQCALPGVRTAAPMVKLPWF